MKTTTAICFVLAGLLALALDPGVKKRRWAETLLSASTFGLLFFLLGMFTLQLLNFSIGVEKVLVSEGAEAIKSVNPGEPSLGTSLAFLLVAVIGLMRLFHMKGKRLFVDSISMTVTAIGCTAVLGYALGLPVLYYYVAETSTAMAFHTGVGLSALGVSLYQR